MKHNNFWEMQRTISCIKEEVEKVTAPFCSAHGVTGSQMRLMLALYHEGEQTVSQLARVICMADANVSTQIKRLCEKDMLQRRRHAFDERQVLISLTPEGKKLAEWFSVYCDDYVGKVLANANKEELETVRKGLSIMARLAKAGGRRSRTGDTPQSIYKENRG